jgi:hypothetical protein
MVNDQNKRIFRKSYDQIKHIFRKSLFFLLKRTMCFIPLWLVKLEQGQTCSLKLKD